MLFYGKGSPVISDINVLQKNWYKCWYNCCFACVFIVLFLLVGNESIFDAVGRAD